MRTALAISLGLVSIVLPTAGFAHTGLGDGSSFVHGFSHPLSGLDHILAMVTVGLFAWRLGGRALWLWPGAFVLALAAGGLLGLAGMPAPFVELGIALSVIVLGAMVTLAIKTPVPIAIGLVGLFGVFHGHAHGVAMPHDANAWSYSAGFVSATVLLHASGVALGFLIGAIGDHYGKLTYRAAGILVALGGIAILEHTL
jgi:urease accessory protein